MARDNDWDYALEKLRLKAEEVSGVKIAYLFEEEMNRLKEEHDHEHEH